MGAQTVYQLNSDLFVGAGTINNLIDIRGLSITGFFNSAFNHLFNADL
jgi:hypothetical protein